MFEYRFPKPPSLNRDQLLSEVWMINLVPHKYEYDDSQICFGFREPLSTTKQDQLAQVVSSHIADAFFQKKQIPFPEIIGTFCWAIIDSFDLANKRVIVRRSIGGQAFKKTCAVSWSIRHAYLAGEINVGDVVLVSFIDNDLDKPLVIDKVVL